MTTPRTYADSTVTPLGGLQGYVNVPYKRIVDVFGEPNGLGCDDFKVDAEWWLRTPAGGATLYNWKPELPHGISVSDITTWHIGGTSREVVGHVIEALGATNPHQQPPGDRPRNRDASVDALVEHLLNDQCLFVPGGQPEHGHGRNRAFSFVPAQPIQLRPHPVNPDQTPVIAGRLSESTITGITVWYVALAHLAHARGSCPDCEQVWREADAAWSEIPEYGDDSCASLFAATSVEPSGALLVHVDDLPEEWVDADPVRAT